LVAFEEPENGVHPRRIEVMTRLLARASRNQQVIVTTHSPQVVVDIVRMIRCVTTAAGSSYRCFDPLGPLFAASEVEGDLATSDDALTLQRISIGGWLDG
ncbi:MAG: AAA family ATPase, partial [Cyanobacteriota bacterium]|nr:AAA family ATPase [Cyanobacteriota bacterium]